MVSLMHILVSTVVFFSAEILASTETIHYSRIFSRPDLKPAALQITLDNGHASQGYIFVAPYFTAAYRPDSGPYIFDSKGELVWSGLDATGGAGRSDIQGLHVCSYKDQDHLCYWSGQQRNMHGSGTGVILDRHYEIVKTVQSCSATASSDMHEFRLTSTGTALITVYQPRYFGNKWILDTVFQEVSLEDGHCLFEWSALAHVDLSESHVPIGSYRWVGDGLSPHTAWDFFHLNSIDIDKAGDFIVSARHADCILKISKVDGSILWRLGGDKSSFQMKGFSFRRQHHARLKEASDSHTLLTLFNNDDDDFTAHTDSSAGMIININHTERVAALVQDYGAHFQGGLVSKGMGSMQTLKETGNTLVSWGTNSTMTEFLSDSSAVWSAYLPWRSYNYRAYKSAWTGQPRKPPALWTYARTRESPMTFYASWNGATEIHEWCFFTSWSRDDAYEPAGCVSKTGFETIHVSQRRGSWAFAQARDLDGKLLGVSEKVETFLPDPAVAESCGTHHCFTDLSRVTYEDADWASADAASVQISACKGANGSSLYQFISYLVGLVGFGCLLIGMHLFRCASTIPSQQYITDMEERITLI